MTCFGIYPRGTKAGLIFEDRGDVVPGFDTADANRFPHTRLRLNGMPAWS